MAERPPAHDSVHECWCLHYHRKDDTCRWTTWDGRYIHACHVKRAKYHPYCRDHLVNAQQYGDRVRTYTVDTRGTDDNA